MLQQHDAKYAGTIIGWYTMYEEELDTGKPQCDKHLDPNITNKVYHGYKLRQMDTIFKIEYSFDTPK